ncbi:MAG: PIG-L family deacetylase [Anaerolineae bacterium]|jgi:LmbE family N-acetylglucosaminyl deacetylase
MKEQVLCAIAHPDDETLFAGGILAMLAQNGWQIHILSATRGEGGEQGDVPVASREELGSVREQELRCAARALGASSVRFLDYVDPPIGEGNALFPYTEELDELAGLIAAVVQEIRPTLLLTHGSGGEYGHSAHVVTHQGILRAHAQMRREGLAPHLYTFSANVPSRQDRVFNLDDPADIVIDVTPWLPAKAAAAECHRTQHTLFFRHHPDAEDMLGVVRSLESLHRVWPREGALLPIFEPYRLSPRRPGA